MEWDSNNNGIRCSLHYVENISHYILFMVYTIIFHRKGIRNVLCDKIINHIKQSQHSSAHQNTCAQSEFHIHDHDHSSVLMDD